MADFKPAVLTYEDDPNPNIGGGPSWSEFVKWWREMDAKGWPKEDIDAPHTVSEIAITKEQQERLRDHIARMAEKPATVVKARITSADIAEAVGKLRKK